jgi:hypothetical protein
MPRSLQDILAHADQLADAFEAWEPSTDEEEPPTPEMILRRAAWKRAEAEREVAAAVARARREGLPWSAVGEALGTSAQAAQKRYSSITVASASAALSLTEAQAVAERLAREHGESVVGLGIAPTEPSPAKRPPAKRAPAKKAPAKRASAKRAPAFRGSTARRSG